jgi:hypothetical protein
MIDSLVCPSLGTNHAVPGPVRLPWNSDMSCSRVALHVGVTVTLRDQRAMPSALGRLVVGSIGSLVLRAPDCGADKSATP